jgi:hypothetical protein
LPPCVLPPDPPEGPLPPGIYPIIGPELATTCEVVQPIAREVGQAILVTLHETSQRHDGRRCCCVATTTCCTTPGGAAVTKATVSEGPDGGRRPAL